MSIRTVLIGKVRRSLNLLRREMRSEAKINVQFGRTMGLIDAALSLQAITPLERDRLEELVVDAAWRAHDDWFAALRATRHA